jgi:carbon storage regulator
MLVLTRKTNESVIIGDDIEICLLEIKGDKVRLGIRAPRSVAVHRKEVHEEIKRANEEAARSSFERAAAAERAISERIRNHGE